MAFGSTEKLSCNESQPTAGIVARVIERIKGISTDTKKIIFPIVLAALSAVALPFISNSEKPESPAQKDFVAMLASLDGFEDSQNRTPYMDIKNYYRLLRNAEVDAHEKKNMTIKEVFNENEKDTGSYEAFEKIVKQQAAAVFVDISSNSNALNSNLSEQQQLLVEESRRDPSKTIEYIEYLSTTLGFTLEEVGFTPEFLAELQRRKTEDIISSIR